MDKIATCSKCNAALTKSDSVIRKYFKRGCYGPDGVFNEKSSIDIEEDICEKCGEVVWQP